MREVKNQVSYFSSPEERNDIDSKPDGIAFIGPDDNLLWFNEAMAKDHNWSEGRLGQNAIECHKSENQDKIRKILDHFHDGSAKPIIMFYPTKRRLLQTTYAPIYSAGGEYLGATCTIAEIQEQITYKLSL